MTSSPYPDHPNPDIADRMPLDARLVLDVGCGTGATAAEYRRRNPLCRLLGIEFNPEAAAVAATRLDEVVVADVEATPNPFGAIRPDCIVYGDVLEHLRDPWAVVAAHAPLLADNGTIVVCMPNVEHWTFVDRLLRGAWAYEDSGLFDRTHLRWFNFETTRDALSGAGLVPHDVMPRIFDPESADRFVNRMEPALRALGIDPVSYRNRARVLQYVWRARRRVTPPIRVVSTMLKPVGGVSAVRVTEPMRAMVTEPSISPTVSNGFDIQALDPATPKIFIFHRPLLAGEDGLEPVRRLIAAGYVVVCEFDDHPDYIPVLQRPDVQNFRAVHAIQTTTEPLAEVLRRDNPEIAVFPNAIARLPDIRNYRDLNRITLFFGGLNREQDWPAYVDAINAMAAVAGERLAFEIVNDRGLFDAISSPHKHFTPLCDYPTYLDILGRCEVSFMPLADTPFNRCKSDLKFLEASAARVTALASRTVYEGSVADGRTGALFATPSDLQQRLARLVASPETGRALADAARDYVARHRMLAYQVAARTAWYHSLWARRAELHASLLARVPELARPPVTAEAE